MDWIRAHTHWMGALVGVSLAIVVLGVVLMPLMVTRMRPDYFVRPSRPLDQAWGRRFPVLRGGLLLLRNLLGACLVIIGVLMLVLPGQGVLTIIAGLSLLTFPGKRDLELRLVRVGPVWAALNWIRRRAGKPTLELPESRG